MTSPDESIHMEDISEGGSLRDAFPAIRALNARLPKLPCTGCGLCCVSPEMTLVEFAMLAEVMMATWDDATWQKFLTEPLQSETRYTGHHVCPIQSEKGLCDFYESRPIICRLEGAPVLDCIGIRSFRNCPYIHEEDLPEGISAEMVDAWIQESFSISAHFYGVYEEPYWMCALTLDCWFAVALDPMIQQEEILAIRDLIHEAVDMRHLKKWYVDKTLLAKKLALIELFFDEAEQRRPKQALRAIKRVLHDFPETGAYYRTEAEKYTALMQRIIRQEKGAAGTT